MQKQVDEYVKIWAQQKKLKARLDELREVLIPYLQKYESPSKGPFILDFDKVPRTNFSWEDFALKMLRNRGLSKNEIKKLIKAEKKKVGSDTVFKITPKINPSWKG